MNGKVVNGVIIAVLVALVAAMAGLGIALANKNHSPTSAPQPTTTLPGQVVVIPATSTTTTTPQATFGVPCSQNPACSGSNNGYSSSPTTSELQSAYSSGYFYGQHLNGPESFCRTSRYADPQLNAQYQDGCGAGYGGGGSSSNNYGGIAGNQAPSPTAPDVQPYP